VLPKVHHLTVVAVCLAEITDATCKITFEDKQMNQLIAENTTPHTDTKLMLKITSHSDMGINFWPHV
jgi:hypothetical protein